MQEEPKEFGGMGVAVSGLGCRLDGTTSIPATRPRVAPSLLTCQTDDFGLAASKPECAAWDRKNLRIPANDGVN